MAIKFANFALHFALLNSINNAMKEEGLDWRLEKIQRGKHMWSHVYLRNSTDIEDIAHTSLYIDTDHNIVYPVIWAKGDERYEDLRNKITDQANVTELSDDEYEEIGEKNRKSNYVYKVNDVYKIVNCGSTNDWMKAIITQVKDVLNVMKNIVF
jgi:predicted transglutaminase-like cysteine proteinase